MEQVLSSLLPSLVKMGKFGPGEFHSFSNDDDSELGFQFGSEISMIKLKLSTESGELKPVRIVLKIQMPDEVSRRVRNTATMFYNEVIMYNEILPYLNKNCSVAYPKLYYGLATKGEDYNKDVLILENMKQFGYKICPEQVFLDYEHICLAMKKIAELHAWSYEAKYYDKERFNSIKSKLKKWKIEKDEGFDYEYCNYLAMKRGIDPFIAGKDKDVLEKFLKAIEGVNEVSELFRSAEEPFGAVIHGDYCKNNLFYKYDPEGSPVGAVFFDLQLSRYGSPAVDLAFFLYLHTTEGSRRDHWDHYLEVYWTAVTRMVSAPLPTYEEFLEHFAARAAYGYMPCSFFLPRMMCVEEGISVGEFAALSKEEKIDNFLNVGGEEGIKSVCSIVSHLIEKKYIHKFLEYYDKNKK